MAETRLPPDARYFQAVVSFSLLFVCFFLFWSWLLWLLGLIDLDLHYVVSCLILDYLLVFAGICCSLSINMSDLHCNSWFFCVSDVGCWLWLDVCLLIFLYIKRRRANSVMHKTLDEWQLDGWLPHCILQQIRRTTKANNRANYLTTANYNRQQTLQRVLCVGRMLAAVAVFISFDLSLYHNKYNARYLYQKESKQTAEGK